MAMVMAVMAVAIVMAMSQIINTVLLNSFMTKRK